MNILITSGATREPIDDVRFLSNVSTGSTGAALAAAFAERGHTITLLHGQSASLPPPSPRITLAAFGSTDDLRDQLRARLGAGAFHAVLHCAAVSDYRPSAVQPGKMTSYADELTLRLVPTPKLLPRLKSWHVPPAHSPSGRSPLVIGFKLTSGADAAAQAAAVARLFAGHAVDAVIHNDMSTLAAGPARPFNAWRHDDASPTPLDGLPALIDWLDLVISQKSKAEKPDVGSGPASPSPSDQQSSQNGPLRRAGDNLRPSGL